MRIIKKINEGWMFSKDAKSVPSHLPHDWEELNLPYTWNGKDGQDGGNDYYRGVGYFAKLIGKDEFPDGDEVYIQLDGVNSTLPFAYACNSISAFLPFTVGVIAIPGAPK